MFDQPGKPLSVREPLPLKGQNFSKFEADCEMRSNKTSACTKRACWMEGCKEMVLLEQKGGWLMFPPQDHILKEPISV